VRAGIITDDQLKTYDRDVRQVINHAAEFATESPEPALEELYTDILK
jgi:pyruvate dehydrogenase E1 component alpha subunit